MNITDIWNTIHSSEGGYLVRRYISFLGHVVAMIVIMKLTWMGGMTETYFTIYTAFIAGHASLEKLIASKTPPSTPKQE